MSSRLLLSLTGLSILSAAPMATAAAAPPPSLQDQRAGYAAFIAEASQRFGVPQAWLRAVIRTESAGDPRAVSPKGAMGLMQIMPDTWTYLRGRYALGSDPFDPRANILGGAALIRELFDRYGSPGWIAAYNAGAGRFEAGLRGRPLPLETRQYVAVIGQRIGVDTGETPTVVAIADPLAWTRAPLFVGSPNDPQTAPSPQPDRATVSAQPTPDGQAQSAQELPASGMFVARTIRRDDQ